MRLSFSSLALLSALSTLALPAIAAAPPRRPAAVAEGKEHQKYPMPAADFRARIGARIEKMRSRMEARISSKNLPEQKAKEARAHFEAKVAQIGKAVDKAAADGTVTKEEAKEVREVIRSLFAGHGKR